MLSALEVADREDELGDWLEQRHVTGGWNLAPVFAQGGIDVDCLTQIEAKVGEWFEFLSAYHDAVLGWVGGADPTPGALRDRLHLIRHAMETLFGGRPSFNACWTYITARKPS